MIKIQRKEDSNWVAFEDLCAGAAFIDEDGDVNIKCYNGSDGRYYAIMLNDGLMWDPDRYHKVKEIRPTLIVEE